MAHVSGDRCLEITTSIGTGNITVLGAVAAHRTLASVMTSNGDTADAVIAGGTQWEVVTITRVSATEFSRAATPISSSTGSAINFSGGTKEIWLDTPSSKISRLFEVVRTQKFTASGTYTPHADMLYCIVEAWGGGGGGGGTAGSATLGGGGGGGSAGGYSRSVLTAADIGASKAVDIGAAGAAGAGGNNAGGTGGNTTLGTTLVVANGGPGGGGSAGAHGLAGAAAAAGTGNLIAGVGARGENSTGNPAVSLSIVCFGGSGGNSSIGSGGRAASALTSFAAGVAGTGNASGGSGASIHNSGGNNPAGGAGTIGYLCVTEFCSK